MLLFHYKMHFLHTCSQCIESRVTTVLTKIGLEIDLELGIHFEFMFIWNDCNVDFFKQTTLKTQNNLPENAYYASEVHVPTQTVLHSAGLLTKSVQKSENWQQFFIMQMMHKSTMTRIHSYFYYVNPGILKKCKCTINVFVKLAILWPCLKCMKAGNRIFFNWRPLC